MQNIYTQRNENLEVFTTVFSPRVCRARQKKVVVQTSCSNHPPHQLAFCPGDVTQDLLRDKRGGTRACFPSKCARAVSEHDGPTAVSPSSLKVSSVQNMTADVLSDQAGGHKLRPQRSREGEASLRGQGVAHGSPSLLYRILSQHRRNSSCHGTTNGAFEPE